MRDTPGSQIISTKRQSIAKQARENPSWVFDNLYHLIDFNLLREAYRKVRKNAAPGVDRLTAKEFANDLEANLRDLHQRLCEQRYVAPPVKRIWIPKEGGKDRPIGVPTFEDKIVQRAVEMLLREIYDQDFYEFSYGFIKGRNQHQALSELRNRAMDSQPLWVIDADISGFFDNLSHHHVRRFIEKRVKDGGILRLIGKWLNAGIVENDIVSYPDKGSPQGGVVSPLLANIYLHYVLDEWFIKEVKPRMRGRCFLIRFADDSLIGCECEEDAQRIMKVLPKRFARFGLTLHPEKTKLFEFSKPKSWQRSEKGLNTLDFLGLTHYWTRSRNGNWVIKRQTQRKRQSRFMSRLWQWCKAHRHDPLQEQHSLLHSKLHGYYQYFGIRSNYKALEAVYEHAIEAWRHWLSRCSQKSYISCSDFNKGILSDYALPKPRIVHAI